MSLELLGFSYSEDPYTMRDGSAQGGATVSSDPVTGVSLNIQSVVNAYADINKYQFWNWDEDARGKETISWQMELVLAGSPGKSAEVLAQWDLWMAYFIGCEPDGLTPSGTNATIETSAAILEKKKICLLGVCFDVWLPRNDAAAYVGDIVFWIGVAGGGKEDTGSFSLGMHNVGEPFQIRGQYVSDAWADESPFGRADSAGWGNYDLRLFIEPTSEPPQVPEPMSLILLGPVLGLIAFRRRCARI
jgi:hypothetical protein